MATSPQQPRRSHAVVTLLTTDSYLPGVLTSINSLLDVEASTNRDFDTVCLVTPATVGQASLKALQKTFDCVVGVAQIMTESWKELDLLGRKDLAASLTKLHLFRLTQYSKVIFLDADTLVLRPLSSLFNIAAPFAAAPDSGWPDAFNSGVMVATPSRETFQQLMAMMSERGSWDGGDQGLLNDFFPDWHRLSYTFNVTPSAYYTYAPAYRRHGSDVAVVHFIGKDKPWKRGTRAVYVPEAAVTDYYGLVGQWYDVYERHFGSSLTYDVASKVMNPPASFKSTYADLDPYTPPAPPVSITVTTATPPPAPIPIAGGQTTPPKLTWDPATSSPPRNSSDLQMREPITSHYDNIWDSANKKQQKARFEPPSAYPNVPSSTHDWYKEVMQKKPDPSAIRPVFPWEKPLPTPTPPSPSKKATQQAPPATRQFPSSRSSSPPNEPSAFAAGPSFTNAWDAIPGINRYAKSLARSTRKAEQAREGGATSSGPSKPSSHESSTSTSAAGAARDDLGGRTSSLVEPKGTEKKGYERRGDASSRDGDDEDTDETTSENEDDADRHKIVYRRPSTGELSPTNTRSRSDSRDSESERRPSHSGSGSSGSGSSGSSTPLPPSSPTKTRRDSRYVPTSPRQSRQSSSSNNGHSSSDYNKTGGLRLNTSAPLPTSPVVSPRLAAQAIRNSAAARLSASGSGVGDGPPVVRATRVFSPDTDTGVVKQQGLAALQRFVENFEAETTGGRGGGGGGGAGSGGQWMF